MTSNMCWTPSGGKRSPRRGSSSIWTSSDGTVHAASNGFLVVSRNTAGVVDKELDNSTWQLEDRVSSGVACTQEALEESWILVSQAPLSPPSLGFRCPATVVRADHWDDTEFFDLVRDGLQYVSILSRFW